MVEVQQVIQVYQVVEVYESYDMLKSSLSTGSWYTDTDQEHVVYLFWHLELDLVKTDQKILIPLKEWETNCFGKKNSVVILFDAILMY